MISLVAWIAGGVLGVLFLAGLVLFVLMMIGAAMVAGEPDESEF